MCHGGNVVCVCTEFHSNMQRRRKYFRRGGALGTERILMMHAYVDIDTKVTLQ